MILRQPTLKRSKNHTKAHTYSLDPISWKLRLKFVYTLVELRPSGWSPRGRDTATHFSHFECIFYGARKRNERNPIQKPTNYSVFRLDVFLFLWMLCWFYAVTCIMFEVAWWIKKSANCEPDSRTKSSVLLEKMYENKCFFLFNFIFEFIKWNCLPIHAKAWISNGQVLYFLDIHTLWSRCVPTLF